MQDADELCSFFAVIPFVEEQTLAASAMHGTQSQLSGCQ